jgi:hypothetical protein
MLFLWRDSKSKMDLAKFNLPKQLPICDYCRRVQNGNRNQGAPIASPIPLLRYTVKMRQELLKHIYVIPNPVVWKWGGILFNTHRFLWNTVWMKGRVNKEVGLLWLI